MPRHILIISLLVPVACGSLFANLAPSSYESKIKAVEKHQAEILSLKQKILRQIETLKSIRQKQTRHQAKPPQTLLRPEVLIDREQLQHIVRSAITRRIDLSSYSDFSHITDIKTKSEKIIALYKESNNSETHLNLREQMFRMDRSAIPTLLSLLDTPAFQSDHDPEAHAMINDTLERLLTKDDKQLILDQFHRKNRFIDLVEKFRYPEAQDLILKKIAEARRGEHLPEKLFLMAVQANRDKAIPLIKDYLLNRSDFLLFGLNALQSIDAPGLNDLYLELYHQHKLNHDIQHVYELSKRLLPLGYREGLDGSLVVLKSKTPASDWIRPILLKHLDYQGRNEDLPSWLQQNRHNLSWKKAAGKYTPR